MLRRLTLLFAPLLWLVATPAHAAVTITFWSHELGNSFPHAFITLRGRPDDGGAPVDLNTGFTPRHISPAILFGKVKGMLEPADAAYLRGSDAQFSMVLNDTQYLAILRLIAEWGPDGDQTYDMNRRNCVTFTQAAAQRLGLAGTDQPKLRKKPRSFLKAVEAANPGVVTPVDLHGKDYIATLSPIPGVDPTLPLLAATGVPAPDVAFAPTNMAAATPPPAPAITAQSMSTSGRH